MSRDEQLTRLKQGVVAWNRWCARHPEACLNLYGLDMSGADLRDIFLGRANLRGARFSHSCLIGAELGGADLTQADLCQADLTRANLSEATLSSVRLTKAQLGGAYLSGADLRGVCLAGADLHGAHLDGADLREATLDQVDLRTADLEKANLEGACLRGTRLFGAYLGGANLSRTVLDGADITQATLEGTRLSRMKIVATTGLESCVHLGPSLIDAHTLSYSDPLPLTFLQGCGLSNSELESLRSCRSHLAGAPDTDIRYQALSSPPTQSTPSRSCVISYQPEDVDLAKRLHDHLQTSGIRCWLDEREWLPDSDVDGQDSNHIRLWIRFSPPPWNAP